MQGRQDRIVASLRRVTQFLGTLSPGVDVGNVGPQLDELTQIVQAFSRHLVEQTSGYGLGRASTAHTTKLMRALRVRHMLPISRTAEALLGKSDGFKPEFRTPYARIGHKKLVVVAGAMHKAANKHAALFIANGFDEDFLAQLDAAVAAVSASVAERGDHVKQRMDGTKGLSETVRRGRVLVRAIDARVTGKLQGTPDVQARAVLIAWNKAKAVHRHSPRNPDGSDAPAPRTNSSDDPSNGNHPALQSMATPITPLTTE